MNFFNLLANGSSLMNFNLQNMTNNFGFGIPSLQLSTPKFLNTEQIIKNPQSNFEVVAEKKAQAEQKKEPNDNRMQILTKQQQLINQYMHLNIQLLSKKLQNLEQAEKSSKGQEEDNQNQLKSSKKKIKKINTCGHNDKEHYAKGMCSNCYHKYGRTKRPWNCPHNKLYANGMCQNCYINGYNKKRREEKGGDQKNEECGQNHELKIENEQQ